MTGYTTGTCASAAARAALECLFSGKSLEEVEVELPQGESVNVPVAGCEVYQGEARAKVVKGWTEDPDATRGIEIVAQATRAPGLSLVGGKGIGRVTKPGLRVEVGEKAINPIPRRMILRACKEAIPQGEGARVVLSVPEGEKVAQRTLNSKLGIKGGISILGTTGKVEPWSKKAYVESIAPQIDVALARGYSEVVLTPGNLGYGLARERGIEEDAIVKTGNYFGYMLERCREKGVERVLLLGYLGKLMKLSGGIFNTHSRGGDAKSEILASHACLCGVPREKVESIMKEGSVQEAIEYLGEKRDEVLTSIAERAEQRVAEFSGLGAGVIFTSMEGDLLARSRGTERLRWAEYLW